jgi:tripartite-type tricarboxylate transporter receptor subunit TctC
MFDRRRVLAALSLLPAAALAQEPRSVTLVVPFAPGGSTDIAARLMAPRLAHHLSRTVVVANRPGAGGTTAADQVRRLPPDGETLMLGTASTHAVNPAIFQDLSYDAERDFAPVALLGVTAFLLVVRTDAGFADTAALMGRLRAEPGRHNYGSAGVGSMPHLAGAWFCHAAGIQAEHVAYRGGGPALQALLGGEITFMIESAPTVAGAIADGRLKALARASARPGGAYGALPALAEQGLGGFDAETWQVALAPAGTPAPVLRRLNAAFNAALAERDLGERLRALGTEPVADSTPESAAAHIRTEIARWRRVVAEAGLRIARQ